MGSGGSLHKSTLAAFYKAILLTSFHSQALRKEMTYSSIRGGSQASNAGLPTLTPSSHGSTADWAFLPLGPGAAAWRSLQPTTAGLLLGPW